MGNFEVSNVSITVVVLAIAVYNIITSLTFKDLARRSQLLKYSRRDLYECGFKPQSQKPIQVSIQFLMISIFFLLYDIELLYLIPLIAGLTSLGLYELVLMILFILLVVVSLLVDYDRNVLAWQL